MNTDLLKKLTLCLSFSSLVSVADAAMLTFTDKANFQSVTGAVSATGTLSNLGAVGSSVKVGDVTFSLGSSSATKLFVGTGGSRDWTTITPRNDIALSGNEDLNMTFNTAVYAAGFDIVEPSNNSNGYGCNAVCHDTTFQVSLKLGSTLVDTFTFNAPNDVLAFIGVKSDKAFDRLEIRDLTGTHDNEYFGEVYTASEVPVPAAAWLFGSALLGLAGLRKNK